MENNSKPDNIISTGMLSYRSLMLGMVKRKKSLKAAYFHKTMNAIIKRPDELHHICSFEAGKIEGFNLAMVEIERQYSLLPFGGDDK